MDRRRRVGPWSLARTAARLGVALALAALVPACAGVSPGEVDALAGALALRPGAVVAEIGAGDGAFALALADRVAPGGRLLANEIDPASVARIRDAARAAGRADVVAVQGRVDDAGLPDGCCDAVYMRGVYHHFSRPAEMAASLRRALRPGGLLAVIDFPPALLLAPWTPSDTPDHGGHGIEADALVAELAASGFEPVRVIPDWRRGDLLQRFYCALFRAPASPAP